MSSNANLCPADIYTRPPSQKGGVGEAEAEPEGGCVETKGCKVADGTVISSSVVVSQNTAVSQYLSVL